MAVVRKTEIAPVDGTPVKRMFWSIISDYDLRTGLCELVDNAIDPWTPSIPPAKLAVHITLDADRQFIAVHDDAGGITQAELKLLIAPDGRRSDADPGLRGAL